MELNITIGGKKMADGNFDNITATGYISAVGNIAGRNISTTGNVRAGNVLGGFLSSSGNIRGGNINTSGLVAAGTISATGIQVGTVSAVGTISGFNLVTRGGQVSAVGNVQGNYIIGNGSLLTNINANAPAFIAKQTIAQNIPYAPPPLGDAIPLCYNSIIKNIGNGFTAGNSTTGSTFVAPTAGFYQINASIGINATSYPNYQGGGALVLYRNAPSIAAVKANPLQYTIGSGTFILIQTILGTTITSTSSASCITYLNVGDYIQAALAGYSTAPQGYWNTGTNVVAAQFSACWIHP